MPEETPEEMVERLVAAKAGKPQTQGRSRRKPPPKSGQFKKGQSGNPGGMKKGTVSLTRVLREMGDKCPPGTEKTYYEHAAIALWEQARKGNVAALDLLFNRLEGKPKDPDDGKANAGLLAVAAAIAKS